MHFEPTRSGSGYRGSKSKEFISETRKECTHFYFHRYQLPSSIIRVVFPWSTKYVFSEHDWNSECLRILICSSSEVWVTNVSAYFLLGSLCTIYLTHWWVMLKRTQHHIINKTLEIALHSIMSRTRKYVKPIYIRLRNICADSGLKLCW